jgi:hypothetical protein
MADTITNPPTLPGHVEDVSNTTQAPTLFPRVPTVITEIPNTVSFPIPPLPGDADGRK